MAGNTTAAAITGLLGAFLAIQVTAHHALLLRHTRCHFLLAALHQAIPASLLLHDIVLVSNL